MYRTHARVQCLRALHNYFSPCHPCHSRSYMSCSCLSNATSILPTNFPLYVRHFTQDTVTVFTCLPLGSTDSLGPPARVVPILLLAFLLTRPMVLNWFNCFVTVDRQLWCGPERPLVTHLCFILTLGFGHTFTTWVFTSSLLWGGG